MNAQNGLQLYYACSQRDFVLVRSLVSSGEASVNFQFGGGETPVMVCCRQDGTDILIYLIQRGANLDLVNNIGQTALHLAAFYNKHLSMALLLQNGANAGLASNNGRTALMLSAMDNSPKCAALLLQHGVAVDAIDRGGRTALWYASSHGHLSIVELLVEGGSDIEIADKYGKKARDAAREMNRTAIVEYLRTPLKDKRWLRRQSSSDPSSAVRRRGARDRIFSVSGLACGSE
jgi:ankyrin repeat protein